MRRTYKVRRGRRTLEREYSYIPIRYVLAIAITVLEISLIIGAVVLICLRVPYLFLLAMLVHVFCVVKIIASDDNPDYKVPWLFFVLILPIVGFMLYFLFYSRKLKRSFIRHLSKLEKYRYTYDDDDVISELEKENVYAAAQARMLTSISRSSVFKNTSQRYYPLGEEMYRDMLTDLEAAKRIIFMEYFIIEEGVFWNSILDVLIRKAREGITVRVIYDDLGCMNTLPGNYCKRLRSLGIDAVSFSRLRGNADSEFNNRNHRKICVIDGEIGYTGGVNIADEYINRRKRFGHWKDTAIRLEGRGVWELTHLFLLDYGMNVRELPDVPTEAYPQDKGVTADGYLIPFGDGPRPLYDIGVGKAVIQNMLSTAARYAYMTTPYLIIDNELCRSIENAALRGVDVRIILPHVPDKKLVSGMTKSFYHRLIKSGVKIYEYEPGFIHAKSYIVDDDYAMIGTVNLDYRSLVHHFENGVWMYKCDCISDLKSDIDDTLAKSIEVSPDMLKTGAITRIVRSVVRIFAPML